MAHLFTGPIWGTDSYPKSVYGLSASMIDGPRIRVGVTGHRAIEGDAEDRLIRQTGEVLARIRDRFGTANLGMPSFTVLSLLAEGADRLVAWEVLKTDRGMLEVPLPLTEDEYMTDFTTQQSRQEFQALLAQASRVVPPSGGIVRPEAYTRAGCYLLNHCHVLIAIWNGQGLDHDQGTSKRGGTAEMVRMARSREMPIFWINTDGKTGIAEEHTAKVVNLASAQSSLIG